MWHPHSRTRSERRASRCLLAGALVGLVAVACGLFDPRTAPPPCDPVNDEDCKPPPEFQEPLTPEIVSLNIKAAVEGRTVQPNYARSLAPEPADQPGTFAYFPDPGAEAQAPPGFFDGWIKEREVQFMLTLLESSGDSLRTVGLDFPRFTVDPSFPATNDLKRYDVDYILRLTYIRGDPPVERLDEYAGHAKWDLAGGARNFWTLLRWEDIGPMTVTGDTIIGTMGTLRAFVGP